MRIAPPRIADEILASAPQTDECLDIPRIASECGKEPLLRLGTELGPQLSLERRLGAGETLVDPSLRPRRDGGAAARPLQEQHVKLAGDLPADLGPDPGEVFRPEFLPTRPDVSGGRR